MAFVQVENVGKQPTSLDRVLGPVLQIFISTESCQVMQLYNRYLQCPVVLNNRSPSDKRP